VIFDEGHEQKEMKRIFKHYKRGKRGGQHYHIKKRSRRAINQVYLNPFKLRHPKSFSSKPNYEMNLTHHKPYTGTAYTWEGFPDKTFIGFDMKNRNFNKKENIDYLSNVLQHEELHSLIGREVGEEASHKLDYITEPTLGEPMAHRVLNPKNAARLIGPKSFNKQIGFLKEIGYLK
jgi:hypothetical protein